MLDNALQYIVPALAAIIGSVSTYLISKSNNKKEIRLTDRQLLSEDEKQFRKELKNAIDMYREESISYKNEITEMRKEIRLLRETNLQLEIENQKLINRVEVLTQQIIRLEKMTNKEDEDIIDLKDKIENKKES